MAKLVESSILLATIMIPMIMASDRNARRGLRRVIVAMVGFNVAYVILALYVVPRLG